MTKQSELDDILEDLVRDSQEDVSDFKLNSLPHEIVNKNGAKQAILDWHNKQLLNELETLRSTATNPAHRDDLYYFDIGYSLVERIEKLKEGRDD